MAMWAYGLSKALVNAYTQHTARHACQNVVANACTPGWIDTDLVGHQSHVITTVVTLPPVQCHHCLSAQSFALIAIGALFETFLVRAGGSSPRRQDPG